MRKSCESPTPKLTKWMARELAAKELVYTLRNHWCDLSFMPTIALAGGDGQADSEFHREAKQKGAELCRLLLTLADCANIRVPSADPSVDTSSSGSSEDGPSAKSSETK